MTVGDASKTLLILATRNVEQAEKVTSEEKKKRVKSNNGQWGSRDRDDTRKIK